MLLSNFDYQLPEELIADKPLEKRDSSRMLVVEHNSLSDKKFDQIVEYLRPGDVMVLNDSKVIPARLEGICEGYKVEINLIKKIDDKGSWLVLAKPGKRLITGKQFIIGGDLKAEIISKQETGEVLLKFDHAGEEFFEKLDKYGSMPLPPYIEKKRKAENKDKKTYQTVYADSGKKGSVAAPTAGLHFTDSILERVRSKGAEIVKVTLHVGAGTFFPVRVDNILEHKMHAEYFEVSAEAASKINNAKSKGGRVFAVGTTSLRVLESAAQKDERISAGSGETNIFIYPGYEFKIVDALLTNFHLPKSTLFMLVSAFMSIERMRAAYNHAISQRYRFFSYGDCSLLIRDKIVP